MIREATLEDAGIIGDIIVAAWRSAFTGIIDPAFPVSMKSAHFAAIIAENIKKGLETIFVFEQEGSVKGFISGRADFKSGLSEIVGFYILPDYQKKGIGKALFNTAESFYSQNGCKEMRLRTLRNAENNEFYRKLGGIGRGCGTIDIGDGSYPGIEFTFPLVKQAK